MFPGGVASGDSMMVGRTDTAFEKETPPAIPPNIFDAVEHASPTQAMIGSMMTPRCSRGISASKGERLLLLKALATHLGVLDARENDTQTILRKSELWDEITRHFNANTNVPRSRQQIQTLYKNMKAKARRYEARLAEMSAGVPPPDPDPISETLLSLLYQQLQHQRKQLENLVAGDMSNISKQLKDDDMPEHEDEPSEVCPEEIMQMSLNEGTEESGIKLEPKEEREAGEDLDEDEEMPQDAVNGLPHGSDQSPDCATATSSQEKEASSHPSCVEDNAQYALSPLSASAKTDALGSPSEDVEQSAEEEYPYHHHELTQSNLPTRHLHSTISEHSSHSSAKSEDFPLQENVPNWVRTQQPLTTTPKQRLTDGYLPSTKKVRHEDPLETRPILGTMHGAGTGNRSGLCCCPSLHTQLFRLAQEEHQMRVVSMRKEAESKSKEHIARMKILSLEEEILQIKLNKMKGADNGSSEECVVDGSTGNDNAQ